MPASSTSLPAGQRVRLVRRRADGGVAIIVKKIIAALSALLLIPVLFVAPAAVAASSCAKQQARYVYGNQDSAYQYLIATTSDCRRYAPWIITIHGGSWINGAPTPIANYTTAFYNAGWQVFDIEYRRGLDVTWAEQKADLLAAYGWVLGHQRAYHLDLHKGAVYGFSAGGQMAAWLGNLRPLLAAVVTNSGVLQPQRVADDDNGLRPLAEPSNPWMHALHQREEYMMGCDHTAAMTPTCHAAWNAFDPETSITRASAPVLILQGDRDPEFAPYTAHAYAYWLWAHGVAQRVIYVPGYGHTTALLFDGTAGSNARFAIVKQWIISHFHRRIP